METRHTPDDQSYRRMTTQELRSAFVFDNLFAPGRVSMSYCDSDRAIVGSAVPLRKRLPLAAAKKEMAAAFFAERREVGIYNVGGEGTVHVDGTRLPVGTGEMAYVGRGTRTVEFSSTNPKKPAQFYFVSFPAHAAYPSGVMRKNEAETSTLGSAGSANRRTIRKYIHPGGMKSCQLVMGATELEEGSVWNTMPPHTHARRSEIYMYYGLQDDAIAVHLMGTPEETRSLILRNRQAVLSPSWSIHAAAGTSSYSFVWAMGGENQDFADMDAVTTHELL